MRKSYRYHFSVYRNTSRMNHSISCIWSTHFLVMALLIIAIANYVTCQTITPFMVRYSTTEKTSFLTVTLYRWPAKQTIPLSVLARNQTKGFWTWNLAVSGSGKGTRKRVGWRKELTGSWCGTTDRGSWHRTPERWDSSREDRVQPRRSSQEMSAFRWLCGIFASNPR